MGVFFDALVSILKEVKRSLGRAIMLYASLRSLKKAGAEIVLLDVGAAGKGLVEWNFFRKVARLINIDPALAETKNDNYSFALSNKAEVRPLYITKHPGCSSLREPNFNVLDAFPVLKDMCEVLEKEQIQTVKYRDLEKEYDLPVIDFVKLDVQGFEFEVLEGFGQSLSQVLGIKLEAHLMPMYDGEMIFDSLCSELRKRGFRLRDIQPCGPASGRELLEIDAYFHREPRSAVEEVKLEIWERLYNLRKYRTNWKLGKNWTNVKS